MRGERRLLWLGESLVRAAAGRLPKRVRDDRYREWTAELPVILHDPDGGNWPKRAARMLGYALDTIRGTTLGPHRGRYRGARSGLAVAVMVALLGPFVYFMVTPGNSLGFWVLSGVTAITVMVGTIVQRRRSRSRSGWWAWTFWLVSWGLVAFGHVALIAARNAHWHGGGLHLITLGGASADVVNTACVAVYFVARSRAFIRRRSQRAGKGAG